VQLQSNHYTEQHSIKMYIYYKVMHTMIFLKQLNYTKHTTSVYNK